MSGWRCTIDGRSRGETGAAAGVVLLALVGVSLGFAGVSGCRDSKPVPPTAGEAARVPAETDVLAAANATGAAVIAPAIVEDPADEPEAVDAGATEPVKLVLLISPAAADVFWGGKRLGTSKPGVPFEIMRPRNSGPLDVHIRAPGFLPYRTRLFTDRDDKLKVSLRRGG